MCETWRISARAQTRPFNRHSVSAEAGYLFQPDNSIDAIATLNDRQGAVLDGATKLNRFPWSVSPPRAVRVVNHSFDFDHPQLCVRLPQATTNANSARAATATTHADYSAAVKRCLSQFSDTTGHRRLGRNTWQDESGVYANGLLKSACPYYSRTYTLMPGGVRPEVDFWKAKMPADTRRSTAWNENEFLFRLIHFKVRWIDVRSTPSRINGIGSIEFSSKFPLNSAAFAFCLCMTSCVTSHVDTGVYNIALWGGGGVKQRIPDLFRSFDSRMFQSTARVTGLVEPFGLETLYYHWTCSILLCRLLMRCVYCVQSVSQISSATWTAVTESILKLCSLSFTGFCPSSACCWSYGAFLEWPACRSLHLSAHVSSSSLSAACIMVCVRLS